MNRRPTEKLLSDLCLRFSVMFLILFGIFAFLMTSCGPGAAPISYSDLNANEIPAGNRPIRMALGETPNPTNQSAYRVFAHMPQGTGQGSIEFCVGDLQQCQSGIATKVEGVAAKLQNGLDVYVTKSFITLQPNQQITVIAQASTGQTLFQSAVIQVPGGGYPNNNYPPGGYPNNNYPPGGYPNNNIFPPPGNFPNNTNIAPGACHKADPMVCEVEQLIVQLTNEKITTSGRQAQTYHPKLAYAARLWAEKQVSYPRGGGSTIGHEGFPSARKEDYVREFGAMDVQLSSENTAMTGSSSSDARSVAQQFVEMWWNSSGHKANMLGGYRLQGAGAWRSPQGGWYAVQLFGN